MKEWIWNTVEGVEQMSKISVIMPVYNAERYLKKTIDSLLNQTYEDFEIVAVDDCSIDKSYEILKSIKDSRLKVYRNKKNQGIAYTRNYALACADSEYIAIMDDDDLAPDYRFKVSVDFLEQNPDIDIVAGNTCVIDEEDKVIGIFSPAIHNSDLAKATLIFRNIFGNSTAMFRKKLIDQHGICYKSKQYGAEDYRFWAECSKYGKISAVDNIMLYWRKHQNETANVLVEKRRERDQAIFSIQKELLNFYGFNLSSEEERMFSRIFNEDGCFVSKKDMDYTYYMLKKMVLQSKSKEEQFSKAFKMACRKQYGKKCSTAFFLWEL